MAIWFTSDHHFFHNNIIKLCDRPFKNLDEMHEALIRNWNAKVKHNEIVYLLGDFLFGGMSRLRRIAPRLNGKIILVKGNHDKNPACNYIECGFHDVVENVRMHLTAQGMDGKKIMIYLSHFPYHPMLQYYKKINKDGTSKVQVIDESGEANHENDRRYLYKRIVDDGNTWLIHGHVHSAWKTLGRQINVGVDVWGMGPVSHQQLLEIICGRKE